jgi:hypothetical protein
MIKAEDMVVNSVPLFLIVIAQADGTAAVDVRVV